MSTNNKRGVTVLKKHKKKLIFVLALVIGLIISGCSKKEENIKGLVTIQQYNQLESNMPYQDVIDLLGMPNMIGTEEVTGEAVYKDVEPYYWNGAAPDSFIMLYFRNEMLFKKEQFGLD
jgi:hypothetical protein